MGSAGSSPTAICWSGPIGNAASPVIRSDGVVLAEGGMDSDDVAVLLLRRKAARSPQPGGRLQQHVAQSDPEAPRSARP